MLPKAELNNGSSLCWRKQFRAQNNLIKTQLSCWRIEMTFVPKKGHFEKLTDEKMVGLGPLVEGLGAGRPAPALVPQMGLHVPGPRAGVCGEWQRGQWGQKPCGAGAGRPRPHVRLLPCRAGVTW